MQTNFKPNTWKEKIIFGAVDPASSLKSRKAVKVALVAAAILFTLTTLGVGAIFVYKLYETYTEKLKEIDLVARDIIQSAFNALAKREEFKIKRSAAISIQKMVRGYQARKRMAPEMAGLQEKKKAAPTLQAGVRSYLARKELNDKKTKRDVSRIQSAVRGYLKRSEVAGAISDAIDNKPFYLPLELSINDKRVVFRNLKDMKSKASELLQIIKDQHSEIRIQTSSYYDDKFNTFRDMFKQDCHINIHSKGLFYLCPKKLSETMGIGGNRNIRYENGIVEEIYSQEYNYWYGKRAFPSGKVELGKFYRFSFCEGTIEENGAVLYLHPRTIIGDAGLDRHIVKINGKLIVLKQIDRENFVAVDEDLHQNLLNILSRSERVSKNDLEALFSSPESLSEFIQHLVSKNLIFSLNSWVFFHLLELAEDYKITLNLPLIHPVTQVSLLNKYSDNANVIKILLKLEPSLIQRSGSGEIPFVNSLFAKRKKATKALLKAMNAQNVALLPRESLFRKIALVEGAVSVEDLKALSRDDQEMAFRLANMYSNLEVLKIFRTLGFVRTEPLFRPEGPSIFGFNMDALEIQEVLAQALKGRIISKSNFKNNNTYIEKGGDVGRLLGRDYILRTIQRLGLKHVKVPEKFIVADESEPLKIRVNPDHSITAESAVDVYAVRVNRSDRKITSDEVKELLALFEAAGFSDIHWGNIIIAADGVYIIDTEFTNFWIHRFYFEGGNQFVEMAKIVNALPLDEQKPFIDELNSKIDAYRAQEATLKKQIKERSKLEKEAMKKMGTDQSVTFEFDVKELI